MRKYYDMTDEDMDRMSAIDLRVDRLAEVLNSLREVVNSLSEVLDLKDEELGIAIDGVGAWGKEAVLDMCQQISVLRAEVKVVLSRCDASVLRFRE